MSWTETTGSLEGGPRNDSPREAAEETSPSLLQPTARGKMEPSAGIRWHFDLDRHLNPFIPPSLLPRLPHPVAHFLGQRSHPPRPLDNLISVVWAVIGIFASISLIEVVCRQVPLFEEHDAPIIVGSFGAAAVLEFYAIESPLAQPRNAILGQLLSSLIGVCVQKLFTLSDRFEDIRWAGSSLACALATAVMALTGTVHPPAGATALIAVSDDHAVALGWYFIPLVLLGCLLMLCIALLVNNIQKRFPIYWWTPEKVGERWQGGKVEVPSSSEADSKFVTTPSIEAQTEHFDVRKLVITRGLVVAPVSMYLRPEEKLLLESLSQRL